MWPLPDLGKPLDWLDVGDVPEYHYYGPDVSVSELFRRFMLAVFPVEDVDVTIREEPSKDVFFIDMDVSAYVVTGSLQMRGPSRTWPRRA